MPRLRLLFFALIGSAGVLSFNLCIPSLLNFYQWSDSFPRWRSFLDQIIQLHRTSPAFQRRPVTNFLIAAVERIGLDPWWAFLVVQFLLLALAAYALSTVAARIRNDTHAKFSLAVFFLSFTVFFSFVTPNDSYDEYSQYLFLFVALYGLLTRRAAVFAGAFFLSLLARETSVLLLPGFLLLDLGKPEARVTRTLKYLLPMLAYALYLRTFSAGDDPRRFRHLWEDNFVDAQRSFETIISWCLAIGLPSALLLTTRLNKNHHALWIRAYWLSLTINTVAVIFLAEARESRLFALPLVFLWPLAGEWLIHVRERFKAGFQWNKFTVAVFGFAAAGIAQYYDPAYRHVMGYRVYAVLLPLFMLLAISAKDSEAT